MRRCWRRRFVALARLSLGDSHAHLDDAAFADDIDAVLRRAVETGVDPVLTVGSDVESSVRGVALAERYPEVYAAVGFHPHEAERLTQREMAELRALAAQPRVRAIGEIGLDYYRLRSSRLAQLEAFRRQLDLAAEMGLPVAVHSRDAEEDTWSVLSEWANQQPRREVPLGVMHCFSGDLALAERYTKLGFLVSLAGNVTFPKAAVTQEVARLLSLEQMVIETDAPALAPIPYRGKRNEPAYLAAVAESIAKLRETSTEVVAKATRTNLLRLLGLSAA